MKKMISPCYKCEEREIGCHGTCERYQTYAGVMATARDERFDAKTRASKLGVKKTNTALKRMGKHKEKW